MPKVIQRVISGEDVSGAGGSEEFLQSSSSAAGENSSSIPTSSVDIRPSALIENDSIHTSGSSLSDMSETRREIEAISTSPPTSTTTRMANNNNNHNNNMAQASITSTAAAAALVRADSTGSNDSSMKADSSRNSSRDWGWFEDVHASENQLQPNKRKDSFFRKSSNKKEKTRMMPTSQIINISDGGFDAIYHKHPPDLVHDAAAMAVTAPTYVLEESLSNQQLWKYTAGNRPPQPIEERAFFEKMWSQNFVRSNVEYQVPVEVLTATTPFSMSPFADGNFDTTPTMPDQHNNQTPQTDITEATLVSRMNTDTADNNNNNNMENFVNKTVNSSEGNVTVLVKGDNVFGTTVSKSFVRSSERGGPVVGVDTVNISIASYRVVESKKRGKYAQFLVIYREGSIRDTIGVWKRYSDFQHLSKKVTHAHEGCASVIANMSPLAVTEEHEVEHLPNAITSWRLLKKRQRWWRCLDAGYLSLKVFLLERFLHDILFESSSPNLLREFISDGKQLMELDSSE